MPAGPFELNLPNPYPGRPAIVAGVSGVCWTRLSPEHRIGNRIVVPDWLVGPSRRVGDETAYVIGPDRALVPAASREVGRDGVVVVLESPHRREFDGRDGPALGPLRDPGTRGHFERCAPDLLEAAERVSGVRLSGRPLILANAVQYQTSLQALKERYGSALERPLRDRVWTELFDAGGAEDLMRRLRGYAPALILLAPTRKVTERLSAAVREADPACPVLLVDEHPASWWRRRPLMVEVVAPGR